MGSSQHFTAPVEETIMTGCVPNFANFLDCTTLVCNALHLNNIKLLYCAISNKSDNLECDSSEYITLL